MLEQSTKHMADQRFFVVGDESRGPVDSETLTQLFREGIIDGNTLLWKQGFSDWTRASSIPEPVPKSSRPTAPSNDKEGSSPSNLLDKLGSKISKVPELPTLSRVPIRRVLVGGLQSGTDDEAIEEEFIVGTRTTTPALNEGVHLRPFVVRNQPLKSAHHTALVSRQSLKGCLAGTALRRRLATPPKPCHLRISLRVLSAGHRSAPTTSLRLHRNLSAPHNGQRAFNFKSFFSMTSSATLEWP